MKKKLITPSKMFKTTPKTPPSIFDEPSSTQDTEAEPKKPDSRISRNQVVINNIDDLIQAATWFELDKPHQRREYNSTGKEPLIPGVDVALLYRSLPFLQSLGKKQIFVVFSTNKAGDLVKTPVTKLEWLQNCGMNAVEFLFDEEDYLKTPIVLNAVEEYPYDTSGGMKKQNRMPKMKLLDKTEIKGKIKEMKKVEKIVKLAVEKSQTQSGTTTNTISKNNVSALFE